MPSFLIATTFLDEPCGYGSTHGVNPEMRTRLRLAEVAIRAIFDALPPDQRIDPSTGRANATFSQWCAIVGPHKCWRANAGRHSSGSAIDVKAAASPSIGCCNAPGTAAASGRYSLFGARCALAAYNRAMGFAAAPAAVADVSGRRPDESTKSVWTRFKAVSDSVARYMSLAVDSDPTEVSRVAIEDAEAVSDDELLATIPEGERLNADRAIAQLEGFLRSDGFRARHPNWSNSARAQYLRILRDYEHVRIAMAIGDPSRTPLTTGNPARGFLNLRSEIVTSLCDQGLRWGACDFDTRSDGEPPNGAIMHFDLADDGGYPEINSLLRFG